MLAQQDLYDLVGATAYDRDGDELGTVDTVFVDDHTGEGTFALVTTGLFGTRASFVPLTDADVRDGGLHVAHTADEVRNAPNLDVDERLAPHQELELYRYYGIPAVAGDDAERRARAADTPTGADLVSDQGIDPTIDGPQTSAADRMRLRRLGTPASSSDDALLEDGDERT